MHDILLLLPMIALLFKKQIVERFENEKCDATERKISLLEKKIKLETEQSITVPNKDINNRIQKLNDKIKELDNLIIMNKDNIEKQSKYYEEDKEKKINDTLKLEKEKLEEEKTYLNFDKLNNLVKDNTLFNSFIIGMIILLILIVFYLFINNLFNTSKITKIGKINVKYDNVLDEIKKSKVKGSMKVKKGSLFSFLDDKKS